MKIEDMDHEKTIWNNLKSFYDIPLHDRTFAQGMLNSASLSRIMSIYNDHVSHANMDMWNHSEIYKGRCFNYHPNVNQFIDQQYVNDFHSDDMRYSYESSLCFHHQTSIGKYFDKVFYPFDFVRSKIARVEPKTFYGNWHHDEDIRECLKVIIPVKTSYSYYFQLEGKPAISTQVGDIIAFDASIPHRIFSDGVDKDHRDYLIFNIPIWWSISDNQIKPSKYYGRNIIQTFIEETDLVKIDV